MTESNVNSLDTADFSTAICLEVPSTTNPYVAQRRYIQGYDVRELWQNCSFFDVLLLHFLGDLPSPEQSRILQTLFVGLMNQGPRDVANRAAMLAGISKTSAEHLLPIGLLACQGSRNGANEVEKAHQFIVKNLNSGVAQCLRACVANHIDPNSHLAPGFGSSYGNLDPLLAQLGKDLNEMLPNSIVFRWCQEFTERLAEYRQGWLASGLVAAVCVELGVGARESMGIFQLAKSVGIVASGMEQTHFPISNNSLLGAECYERTE